MTKVISSPGEGPRGNCVGGILRPPVPSRRWETSSPSDWHLRMNRYFYYLLTYTCWMDQKMTRNWGLYFTTLPFYFALVLTAGGTGEPAQVQLPWGVKAVWSMDRAYRETTPTRERICVNGLWQWQPAGESADAVPNTGWGYLKVPAPWPGITGDYMWRDTQTVYPHPAWETGAGSTPPGTSGDTPEA